MESRLNHLYLYVKYRVYAYDALLRTAELAEKVWGDEPFGAGLRREARALRARFEEDFWMEDRGYYAVALDGRGRRVDSITSNPGHLLWSGILSRDRAGAVVDRLMGVELFGGWGIRTMASGEGGYDPNSYHNGSVWPHDNALISQGLQRYGYRDAAARVARRHPRSRRAFRLPAARGLRRLLPGRVFEAR